MAECAASSGVCSALSEEQDEGTMLLSLRASKGRTEVAQADSEWQCCFNSCGNCNPPLEAKDFTAYPGYTGDLKATGVVTVAGSDSGQVITFDLDGVDPRCSADDNSDGPKNSCGVHIHAGTTCTEAGGHEFNHSLEHDPWLPISYKSDAEGKAVDSDGTNVATMLPVSEVYGKVIVVHDHTGARIACSPLEPFAPLEARHFSPYPGYEGPLKTHGFVKVTGFGAGQVLKYQIQGADEQCKDADNSKGPNNSCGIHIHAGVTCAEAGGHKFDHSLSEDPWLPVSYQATKKGYAEDLTGTQVKTRVPMGDLKGTIVIHDITGARIACSELEHSFDRCKTACEHVGGSFIKCPL